MAAAGGDPSSPSEKKEKMRPTDGQNMDCRCFLSTGNLNNRENTVCWAFFRFMVENRLTLNFKVGIFTSHFDAFSYGIITEPRYKLDSFASHDQKETTNIEGFQEDNFADSIYC